MKDGKKEAKILNLEKAYIKKEGKGKKRDLKRKRERKNKERRKRVKKKQKEIGKKWRKK